MVVVPQLCVVCCFLYLCVGPPGSTSGTAEIGEKGKCIGVCDRKINWGADGGSVHVDGFHGELLVAGLGA